MKIKATVSKHGERKMIEIPSSARENFKIGENVFIEKVKKWKKR